MIFIFEDNRKAALSKLFRSGYNSSTSDRFVYAEGNGNLSREVDKVLRSIRREETDEQTVVVIMDVVPNNPNTVDIFSQLLLKEYELGKERLFIFPIVCSEYYFLKSLQNTDIVSEHASLEICLSRMYYKHDPIIKTDKDKDRCKSYERYTKFLIAKGLRHCTTAKYKPIKEAYMVCDCIHSDCVIEAWCKSKEIKDKALDLLQEYEAIPGESMLKNKQALSLQDMLKMRQQFIVEYNRLVQNYIDNGEDPNMCRIIG